MQLDIDVDLPGFIDLFEFVVNMGANTSPWIPQLLEFGSNFVDPKTALVEPPGVCRG